MPYFLSDSTSGLIRTTGLPTGDYTCMVRYKTPDVPVGGTYKTVGGQLIDAVLTGNAVTTYGGDAAIYSTFGTNHYYVDVFFTDDHTTGTATLLTNTEYVLIYIRKTLNGITSHYFLFISPGSGVTVIGSVVKDLTGANINALVLGNDGVSYSNVSLAYFRDWSAALSNQELLAEASSSRALRTDNLVSDCPFETDLLDKSGNGHGFVDQGLAGAFTTAVPTPTYTIATLPFTQIVPQATFNIANLVWVKYTNTTPEGLGIFTNSGGTFVPKNELFLADGVSRIFSTTIEAAFAVVGPGDYFFKITRNAGGASNFDFTTKIDSLPILNTVPSGSIIVNDDSSGFWATAFSLSTGIIGLLKIIPGSELGATLSNGISLWHDRFTYDPSERLKLISANFTVIKQTNTTPLITAVQNPCCICTNSAIGDKFYILNNFDGKVWKMDTVGVLTDTGILLPGTNNTSAIGVNADETILYYATGTTNPYTINKWDMVGNISAGILITLATGGHSISVALTGPNGNKGEILVLQDGTIVTYWHDFSTVPFTTATIVHITTGGVIIDSVVYIDGTIIDHINYTENAGFVNVWLFNDAEDTGTFSRLALATGVKNPTFAKKLFSEYQNETSNDVTIFGPSNSCTMLTFIFKNFGGIYKIQPNKRNDTLWLDVVAQTTEDVKIPDPLFRTALLGD